jgi:hypothetical protein
MLHEAVDIAAARLPEPIRRITVSQGRVTCWSRTQTLSMSFYYQDAYSQEGAVMPGSGRWCFGELRVRRVGLVGRLLARLSVR